MNQHDQLIEDLLKRLDMLRRTLRLLLLQKATTGMCTQVHVLLDIDDKRVDIQYLKAELRRLGLEVDDQFDDTAKGVVACASDEPPKPSAAGSTSCGALACPQPAPSRLSAGNSGALRPAWMVQSARSSSPLRA